jgi:hypothetical protein
MNTCIYDTPLVTGTYIDIYVHIYEYNLIGMKMIHPRKQVCICKYICIYMNTCIYDTYYVFIDMNTSVLSDWDGYGTPLKTGMDVYIFF